jgi:hypothetical protein
MWSESSDLIFRLTLGVEPKRLIVAVSPSEADGVGFVGSATFAPFWPSRASWGEATATDSSWFTLS